MIVRSETLTFRTRKSPEFLDITPEVEKFVKTCGVRDGIVLVFSCHTTAAIRINENEPLLLRDMEEFLKRLAPRELYYCHNDFGIRTHNMTPEECPNAHAHLQHLLLGASEAVPVRDGKLFLGRWQRIFLVELDRPRERKVLVQVVGCV
ncbi:YjbQ family protein [Candidatus Bipolaricaulota bacterium]|nr:YjbQ family protein [Candidatus Bipolaricaulota bacterium]